MIQVYTSDGKGEGEAQCAFLSVSDVEFLLSYLSCQHLHLFVHDESENEVLLLRFFHKVFISEIKLETLPGLLVVVTGTLLGHVVVDPRCFCYFELLCVFYLVEFEGDVSSQEVESCFDL